MTVTLLLNDCLDTLKTLPDASVQCCVTSPPFYGLRDYGTAKWEGGDEGCDHKHFLGGHGEKSEMQTGSLGTQTYQYKNVCGKCGATRIDNQIGLEETPEAYVAKLVDVFREVKRVLKDDGVLWLNLGDSYWGGKGKSGYELPDEAEARRANGETFQTGHNIPGYMDMRPTDGKHPVIKPKDLIGIPWMVAFALRADGWYLRSDIIWAKPNPMPESVTDRCTKSHEYIFLLTKSAKYYYDNEAIKEVATGYDGRKDDQFKGAIKSYDGVMPGGKPQTFAQRGQKRWEYKNLQEDGQQPNTMHLKRLVGEEYLSPVRNKRDVWTVATKPYKGAHFATFPPDLIEPCILAGSRPCDTVLDPFNGSGTTGAVSIKHGRNYIGCELNPDYIELTKKRLAQVQPALR